MREYGQTHMKIDLAQSDGLWSFLASMAWSTSRLWSSPSSSTLSIQIHVPGKIEQERLVSCLELSYQLCLTVFLFSSIWVQDHAQGRSNCKETCHFLFYRIYRGAATVINQWGCFYCLSCGVLLKLEKKKRVVLDPFCLIKLPSPQRFRYSILVYWSLEFMFI